MNLDKTDIRILDHLQRDGSLTNVELARKIGLSPSPCLARVKALEAAGVPCAPINTIPELAADPQTAALGMLAPVPSTDYQLVPLPLSFQGERPAITAPAPALGEYRSQ